MNPQLMLSEPIARVLGALLARWSRPGVRLEAKTYEVHHRVRSSFHRPDRFYPSPVASRLVVVWVSNGPEILVGGDNVAHVNGDLSIPIVHDRHDRVGDDERKTT